MTKRYSLLGCEIEVDKEKTSQWYAHGEAWDCGCGHCVNFLETARTGQLPDKVLGYLSLFGIPPEKATYVCCLTENNGMLFYQFSYRIAGHILKEDASSLIEDARFCHEPYPYSAPNFPEPHFDMEFFVELPWIIAGAAQ